MLRAAWMALLFFGIGSGIVVLRRWWGEWHPIWFGEIIVLVGAHGRADRLRHPVAAAGTVTRARLHIHD
jgi:hypothetical protein